MSAFLALRSGAIATSHLNANLATKLRGSRNAIILAGHQICRTFLSPAYSCDDIWRQQRKQCESLKHITPERYFFELNQKYQQKHAVSPVDVDIYINSVHKAENQDELEHIVKRFRSTKKTVATLDSTHHAVCRFYLRHGKRDQLLEILNKRVQYGVFPDTYIYNLLIDAAIQEDVLEDAFEVIKLMTLQEDSGNKITKTLALYTLNQLLVAGKVGPKPAEEGAQAEAAEAEEEPEDEDDIEYIRVPYLTNPHFDDHFDLTNREHIFGKSLYFFGYELGKAPELSERNRILSSTAQIVGLIFYQKWDKLNKVLDRLNSSSITPEPLNIAQKHLELIQDETIQSELKKIITRLESVPQTTDRMQTLIETRLVTLPDLEPADIEAQKKMFANFENTRVEAIKSQLDALLREQRQQEIENKKAELEMKKRLYYFFENFPKHEIDFVDAEQRIKEIQSKTVVDEDYIPPEKY